MKINTVPPSLYKYLPPRRAFDVLKNLRIRFSQVSVLNDADEFRPPYKGVASREEIEKTVRERFPLKYPNEYAEAYRRLPVDEADALINRMVPEWANKVEADYEKSIKRIYEELNRNLGILSLSETPTSRLMWSFYSDGGRGFLIEWNTNDVWFNAKTADNDSFRHLRPVQYVADRKPKYLLATSDDEMLYTKVSEWDFEKEWRIIRGFNDAVEKAKPDSYGTDVLLFDIPPSAIKSIVFGYRTTIELENEIREMVGAKLELSHVIFQRAVREANGHIEINPSIVDCAVISTIGREPLK